MGFFIFSNNGKINYGIKNYIADTEKDLKQIPTRYPGSMVYVIETQKFYMVNQNGTWVETSGGGGSSSEIDETQVNALIDAKIAQVPTLPDPTDSDNQVLMTQDGAWTVSTIPEGQTVIIDETLSTADNDHVPSTKLVTNTVNSINNAITAINEAGYQTETDVQTLINNELSDITSFEYYLCGLGEYDLTTSEPDADAIHATSIEHGDNPLQPDSQHIYLTPGSNDNLNMYAYINEAFVFLGTTEMDLDNYYDKDYIDTALEDLITLDDVSNAGYLTSVDWSDIGDKPVSFTPVSHTHDYSDITNAPINSSGETTKSLTLADPLTVTGGDAATAGKIIIDKNNQGQITDDSTSTLFGFLETPTVEKPNPDLTIGNGSYALKLRGNGARPTFNGNNLALSSDILAPIASINLIAASTDAQYASAKSVYDTRRAITVQSAVEGVTYLIQVKDSNNFDVNTLPDDNTTITIIK